tara:strand:+ start:3343 stop:4038 length:696 start_codon:yes stop_codon:yes gene_type:complete
MATSNTKAFELDVAEYVEEAYERCGLELRTAYDLKTATRSLNLLLADWANRGINAWTIKSNQISMVKDQASYSVNSTTPTAVIDVLDVYVRETTGGTTTDVPLTRMSRAEYSLLATKSQTGKPNQYWLDKQESPVMYVWPVPDKNSTYTVFADALTRMDDAGAGANTVDLPFEFYPSLASGLAYYLSIKRAPDRMAMLKAVYDEEFLRAMSQNEERAPYSISPDLRSYNTA